MKKNMGTIRAINGNLITVEFSDRVSQNEVGYAIKDGERLKSEIIRIQATRRLCKSMKTPRDCISAPG
jgi:V/A-type H+-transporting ATPase subunit A